jgi:colanic acid biosynthesis glycosyl transferase WcaI
MKILIYGINYSPELTGVGKYTGEMSEWMAKEGHELKIITAPPYYPEWKISSKYKNKYSRSFEKNIEIIRCPIYVPKKRSPVLRILHLISFSLSSFFYVLKNIWWKPDIVIQVIPTIFCSTQTLLLCKLSGAKSIIHIQDYEIDAMYGLSMMKNKYLKRIIYIIEQKILKSFDLVSTISEEMIEKAIQKGVSVKKVIFFPNWVEINSFLKATQSKKFIKGLGIDPNKKIVLYAGNIGEKQGLEIILNVAKKLLDQNNIHFLIIGDGTAKIKLQNLAKKMNLTNINFEPLQPYEDLPKILKSVDCHLVIQKIGISDAVLPSKLTGILASGINSVITAKEDTSLGKFCEDHPGISVLVHPESETELVKGIATALKMPSPNSIAQEYAQNYLDKEVILKNFLIDIS